MATEREGKGKKNVEAPLSNEVQRNLIFGRYADADLISMLKGLALDPCSQQFTVNKIRPLFNQILRVRKVMTLNESETPWRKRKLEQFLKEKLRPPSFAVSDQQKLCRRNLSHASSASCLVNSAGSNDVHADKILPGSRSPSSLLTSVDGMSEKLISTRHSLEKNCHGNNISPLVDSDESVMGSNLPTPKNLTLRPSVETKSPNHLLNSPNLKLLQSPRKSKRLQNFIGDSLERCVVPVGPRFQVDIPEWDGLLDKRMLVTQYKRETADSKWLGTKVWPTEARTVKYTGKQIGDGRPDTCRCLSPGSVDCIKHHCLEARLFLQSDIGSAFFSWKFDEMGAQVSKSWMLKDQKTFESIMKMRPSSNGKNFLKQALMCIPQKSRGDIVSYYFNSYLPGRISLQTRSLPIEDIDTDDESEDLNLRKRPEGKAVIASKSWLRR